MNFFFKRSVTIACCVIMAGTLFGCALQKTGNDDPSQGMFAEDPNISKQSKDIIRVGCFKAEEYDYWNDELKAMGAELYNNRVISNYQARNYDDMEQTWEALSKSACLMNKGRLVFAPDCIYTMNEMEDADLKAMLESKEIDLMLTFGTEAGKYLTENADKIGYDYMVFGAANTVASGILKSETERYNDRSFAQIDTGETRRPIEAAYDMFKFRDIGVVYEDNESAYVYSGIDHLEEMSEKYGFNIHRVFVDESDGPDDDERYYTELKAAYDKLQPDIDALYITNATMDDEMIPQLISDMIDAGVITITQVSEEQCRLGALMYLTVANAEEDGQFMAQTIEQYCKGTPVSKLDMVYVVEPRLYLNYETIKRTGVKVPMTAYLIAEEVYTAEDMP
ncbi:MAG: hypothetical protein K6G12_00460 [Lachnospiraceae bacterium]|nr:hypothetical protein [Lachnospiraceae bacterium]